MPQSSKKRSAMRPGGRSQVIRHSRPGPEITKKAQINRLTRVSNDPVEINKATGAGKCIVRLSTGDFTYRAIPFGVRSSVDLGADSYALMGGGYMVTLAALSKYISDIRLEVNGGPLQEWDTDELITVNDFYDFKFHGGFTGFHFPGEEMYDSQKMRDLFALGTANLRSLKLILKQTNLFDSDTMDIVCVPHYVQEARPATFVTRTQPILHTFSGVGKHTYNELPTGDDIQSIWVIGDGISHLKLEVDGETLIDGHIDDYKAYLRSVNRDNSPLDDQWFIDFQAEGEATALAALDLPGEVRRGAKVKVTLTTTQAETPVKFITNHVGTYHKVR